MRPGRHDTMSPVSHAFETLGVPARFDLDEADLHKRFIRLSSEHHPDRYTDPLDQADAAERAAAVNEAYRLLRDPESRALTLLAVLGGETKVEDKELPQGFLMEVMEVRERMEEAQANDDAATLAEIGDWAKAQKAEQLSRIAALFKKATGEDAGARGATLREVRRSLNALRYFERMGEGLSAG